MRLVCTHGKVSRGRLARRRQLVEVGCRHMCLLRRCEAAHRGVVLLDDVRPAGERLRGRHLVLAELAHRARRLSRERLRLARDRVTSLERRLASLASLERRRASTFVDYRGQFGEGSDGTLRRQPGAAAAAAFAVPLDDDPPLPPPARGRAGKGRGRGRGPKKNTWRTVGGRLTYYDDHGKTSTGSRAHMQYEQAKAAGLVAKARPDRAGPLQGQRGRRK